MVKSLRNKTNRNKRKVRRQHKKRTVKRYKRRGGGFISDSWSSIKIPQCVKDNPKAYVLNPNGPGYLKDYNDLKTERDKERGEFFNPLIANYVNGRDYASLYAKDCSFLRDVLTDWISNKKKLIETLGLGPDNGPVKRSIKYLALKAHEKLEMAGDPKLIERNVPPREYTYPF